MIGNDNLTKESVSSFESTISLLFIYLFHFNQGALPLTKNVCIGTLLLRWEASVVGVLYSNIIKKMKKETEMVKL